MEKLELQAGMIETMDGLIPEDLLEEIFVSVHSPAAYRFGGKSNPDDQFGFWLASIDSNIMNAVPAFRAYWDTVEKYVTTNNYRVYHMMVNANSFGDCTTIHSDIPADKPDAKGYYTILYYANSQWDPNWAGETVFFNDERDDIIKSVHPRPGRIAIFDSRIPHCSRPPSRSSTMVRFTIASKIVLK